MFRRIGINGLVGSAVNLKIRLAVSIKIQSPYENRSRNRALEDACGDVLVAHQNIDR
jgi:hypothetical protein